MNKIILVILIIFSRNILGMESAEDSVKFTERSPLLNHVVVNIPSQKKSSSSPKNFNNKIDFNNIKTDKDFIDLLPIEIWHEVLEYIDIKNKENLGILYFFAPRIGFPPKLVKSLAINLGNCAAIKSPTLDDWEDKINNPCKSWGNLKKYKQYSATAKKSRELIKKHLKDINSEFLDKIKTIDSALSSNNKSKEDLEQFWNSFWQDYEYKIAAILGLTNILYPDLDESDGPDFSNCAEKDLKKAYIEIQKILLLGKRKIIVTSYKAIGVIILLFVAIPILAGLFVGIMKDDIGLGFVAAGSEFGLGLLFVITWFRKNVNVTTSALRSIINLLCNKKTNQFDIKLSRNLILAEMDLKKLIKNPDKIEAYQDIFEEEKNLDKILIEALNGPDIVNEAVLA